MKDRFLLAMSWWCFAHASLIGFVVISMEVFDVEGNDLGVFDDLAEGYFNLFPADELIFVFPVISWLVLWVVTGSPRILPWRKL